jgi:hypothetical protein
MARAKRPLPTHVPGYPNLSQFVCGRRRFLRTLTLGAVSLGVGSRLLSACTESTGIVGSTRRDGESREDPEADLHNVRLPESGFASAYLSHATDPGGGNEDFLHYAVSFSTYNERLAHYYRDAVEETLAMLAEGLYGHTCHHVENQPTLIEDKIRDILERHYTDIHGHEEPLIHTLLLIVDYCEHYTVPAGVPPDLP